MEIVKGRGINCENEVYFDFVDDCVVMTMYRDMPGTPPDRLKPNVIKSFSVDVWGEINSHLSNIHDSEIDSDSDSEERGPEDAPDISTISSLPQVASSLPPLTNKAVAPLLTKDEIQEKFDPITGTVEPGGKEEDGQATSDKEAPETNGSPPKRSESSPKKD